METNPYAAPAAVVDDVPGFVAGDLESRKASRGKRLGAALIDVVINVVWLAPVIMGAMMAGGVRSGIKAAGPMAALMVLGLILLLALVVINCMLVYRDGQTIGKRMLDMSMVRSSGARMGLARYLFLRMLPISLLGAIPWVGQFAGLVDAVLIFGAQRRCLHDLIADTIVIDS
ncbi:MAG: RDD family protein [Rhodanobacter sp.]